MILISENLKWQLYWTDGRRVRITIVSKDRKNRGMACMASAYQNNLGKIVVSSRFPIPVNVRSWISKALLRGGRFR